MPEEHDMGTARRGWGMNYLGSVLRRLGTRGLLLAGGYAFFLTFGYLAFESSTLLAALGNGAADAWPSFLVLAIAGRVIAYAALLAHTLRLGRDADTGRATALGFTLAFGGFLLAYLCSYFSTYAPPDKVLPWLLASGALLGAGGGVVNLTWARFCATLSMRAVYLFVLLSFTLSLVLYAVVTSLPAPAAFPLGAALLLASALMGRSCLDLREAVGTPGSSDNEKGQTSKLSP